MDRHGDVDDALYVFGPFTADPIRGLLYRQGAPVDLAPRSFQLLVHLLRARGDVVDKEDLLRDVWPHVAIEPNTLAKHVSALRKALRVRPDDPAYILTVSGRGYRLAALVTTVPRPADIPPLPHATARAVAGPDTDEPTGHRHGAANEVRPSLRQKVRDRALSLLLLIGLLAAVAALLSIITGSRPRPESQAAVWQLTTGEGLQHQPAWSPDGAWIAYTDDTAGRSDIWRQPVGQGQPIRITKDGTRESHPSWSPDGSQLAFQSDREGGGLFVVPAFGGQPRRVTTFGCCPSWSPDGTQLLFFNEFPRSPEERQAPYVVPVRGGVPRQIAIDPFDGFEQPTFAWHPDGRRISVWAQEENLPPLHWRFRTFPLDGGPSIESIPTADVERRLRESQVQFSGFVWAATGDALFFSGHARGVADLWRIDVDPVTLRWIGGPTRLTVGANIGDDVALAPDGRRLVFTNRKQDTRVWRLPLDPTSGLASGAPVALTPAGIVPRQAQVSDDGTRLAYVTSRAGFKELWSQRLTDGARTLLASARNDQLLGSPRWSRDSRWMVYCQGRSKIMRYDAETGVQRPLTSDGKLLLLPSDVSRDGTAMLATCELNDREVGICRLPLDAAAAAAADMRILTSRAERSLWQPRFSPDDRWVAFTATTMNDIRATTLYVMPASGGDWIPVTTGDTFDDKPRWSSDGRTLYYISNRGGVTNVWSRHINPSNGQPEGPALRVTAFDGAHRMLPPILDGLSFSVAGNALVLSLSEVSGQLWVLENIAR